MFEAIARGEIKALWVMGTNPAVSLPDADAVRAALKKLDLFVVSENVRLQRHGQRRRACAAAGAGLGREIRHGDQFGAPHLAPARVPAAARRGAAGLVDRRRGRQAARLRRGVRLQLGRRHVPRTCRAVGIRERRQRAISISARCSRCRTRRSMRLAPVQWPIAARTAQPQARFFAEGGFFTNDRKARFVAPEIPALRSETTAAPPAAAEHRPHPRSVAHHDAHRPEPAARPASAGAVRRGASR